jgi:hypothetical protein
VIALDEDGYLWRGIIEITPTEALEADWTPIRGPADAPPFMDTRSRLDRLEDSIRDQVEERDRIRKRLDSLPKMGDSEL